MSGEDDVHTLFEFDPISNECNKLSKATQLMSRIEDFGMCVCRGLVYIIGGRSNRVVSRQVVCYNRISDKWSRRADMLEERCQMSAGVINGELYAVGGVNQHDQMVSSVQKYNPDTNEWHLVTPMNIPRYGMGIGTIKTKMYAVGGHGLSWELNSCEVYDSITDQWSYIANLNYPSAPDVCVLDGLLYALGFGRFEVYSPQNDSWSMMPVERFLRVGGAAVQGRIYIFILMSSTKPSCLARYAKFPWDVICFDPNTKKWQFVSHVNSIGNRIYGRCT